MGAAVRAANGASKEARHEAAKGAAADAGGARLPTLLSRLGLGGTPPDVRFCWRVVTLLLLLYVFSFAVFYPRYATNHDEANYIRQTQLALLGTSTFVQIDPLTGEEQEQVMSSYPMATALLMAPFVALFGWRAAFAVACLTLVAVIAITARWLQDEGRSPGFALLLLGFPPMLVMGRVAMSDVPSAAWVALGFWLFWRGIDARGRAGVCCWLAAGFVAGASVAFRASNPLLFVPLFAGTVLRRERRAVALVAGGVLGLAVRLATQAAFFGDAMFERSAYRFSPETVDERLWIYLLALLVFLPGGLVLSMLYRGRRRPEVLVTIATFVTLYLFQEYSTVETGLSKRLVLGLRYLLPVLPIMIFGMAESTPRLFSAALATRTVTTRTRLERLVSVALVMWLAGLVTAVLAVHPAFATWSGTQDEIRDAIEAHIPDDGVLITNRRATQKFIPELDRKFKILPSHRTSLAEIDTLLGRHGEIYVALLDRTDSAWWREQSEGNVAFLESLPMPRELLVRVRPTPTDDLRIWRLTPMPGLSDEPPKQPVSR